MSLGWKKNIDEIPVDVILLFEECQLLYFPYYNKLRKEYATVFRAKPYLEWYVRNKAPLLAPWLDELMAEYADEKGDADVEISERTLVSAMEDWVVYVTEPDDYDRLSFNRWDDAELTGLTDFRGKTVIDIGSGTGRQAFAVAQYVQYVYCVEPVYNLRKYLRNKATALGFNNVFAVDGLIDAVPFPDGFADIAVCGHVFGDTPEAELAEMVRVVKPGGMIIMCHGGAHDYLISQGFNSECFLEPGEDLGSGWKRKYWKTI